MTGFGRAEGELQGIALQVEIKGLNHRYCDVRVRLPRELMALEIPLTQIVQKKIARGRIEVLVRLGEGGQNEGSLALHPEQAQHYAELYRQMIQVLDLPQQPPSADLIFQLPGVLSPVIPSSEEGWLPLLEALLLQGLEGVEAMRLQEGETLRHDLNCRLDTLQKLIEKITQLAPRVPLTFKERLQERLARFAAEVTVEPERIAQEVALLADRCDISEELTRFGSHLEQFRSLLEKGGVIGRQLDFLCQELHREATTLGNKALDAEIGTLVVGLKAEIEKIREQVQNIE